MRPSDPLAVVIDDGTTRRDVSRWVSDLSFSETAPGGHSVGSCTIQQPLTAFPNLGPNDRVYVYDAATGEVPFEGYTNNPGRHDDATGEGFELTANGGAILAADRAERLIYRATALDDWSGERIGATGGTIDEPKSIAAARHEVGIFPKDAGTRAGDPGLLLQFPKGTQVDAAASSAVMSYRQFRDAANDLGAVRFYRDGGATSSSYKEFVFLLSKDGNSRDAVYNADLSGIGSTESFTAPGPRPGYSVVAHIQSQVTTEVGTSNAWMALGEIGVSGQPVDRYGQWYANPRTTYWLASEVAEDLFGRLLRNQIDQPTLEIVQSTFQIDTLTFLDPTTAAGALSSLLLLEDYDWGIGASRRNGKHRAWFRPWPTTPRYVLDDRDAISLPGSDDQQVNRVAVEWVSQRGYTHVTVVGANVPELGNGNPVLSSDGRIDPAFVGRVKDADKVSLPDGHGSAANALQAGARALAEKNRIALAGTATVTRPLLDLQTGRYVMPWSLRAGTVARLATQGVDVRVTEKAYSHNDQAATLTLNTPVPSLERMLAQLAARRRR